MSADTTRCCEHSASQCCGGPEGSSAPAIRAEPPWRWHLGVGAFTIGWFLVYGQLPNLSEWLTGLLPVDRASRTGEAIAFFLYDAPKVILLLALIVFWMGVVRSFFSPEKTRTLLAGRREGVGNVLSAGLGVFTPFCSCSAVPLFIGFVSAGVPLGVTFSFLIAAPMVNEVALVLLWGLVGWQVALTYLIFGLGLAIVGGWVIGRFRLEPWLQGWVREIHAGKAAGALPEERPTMVERYQDGIRSVKDILGKVWIWVVIGITLGALIHGYVPEAVVMAVMGSGAWWSVPAAVIMGIPMYSGAAGMIPIIEALLDKGAELGTVLAFMMSVIALSLPEMLILRKVLTGKLIAVFIAVVGTGILVVGLLFNLIF